MIKLGPWKIADEKSENRIGLSYFEEYQDRPLLRESREEMRINNAIFKLNQLRAGWNPNLQEELIKDANHIINSILYIR